VLGRGKEESENMRTMVKFTVPTTEETNALIREGSIAQKMETILGKLQPEAAYFCPIDGKRGDISFSIWRTNPRVLPSWNLFGWSWERQSKSSLL